MKKMISVAIAFVLVSSHTWSAQASESRIVSIENQNYDYTVRVTSDGVNMKVEKCEDSGVCQQIGSIITEQQFRDASAKMSHHDNAVFAGAYTGFMVSTAALVGCVLAKGRCAKAVQKLSNDQRTLLVAGSAYGGAIVGATAGGVFNDNDLTGQTTGDIWMALRSAEGEKVDEENFNVLLETTTSLDRILESYSIVLLLAQSEK